VEEVSLVRPKNIITQHATTNYSALFFSDWCIIIIFIIKCKFLLMQWMCYRFNNSLHLSFAIFGLLLVLLVDVEDFTLLWESWIVKMRRLGFDREALERWMEVKSDCYIF
jgi:hypothetical protein